MAVKQETELIFYYYGDYNPRLSKRYMALLAWLDEMVAGRYVLHEDWFHSDIADDDEWEGARIIFREINDAVLFKLRFC